MIPDSLLQYAQQFDDKGDDAAKDAETDDAQGASGPVPDLAVEEQLRAQAVSAAAMMVRAEVDAATEELKAKVEEQKQLREDELAAERAKQAERIATQSDRKDNSMENLVFNLWKFLNFLAV